MDLRRKVIGIPLQKSMTKDEATGFLTVKGIFTSDNRDQVGDIITRSATERAVGAYREWGNIRRMHAPDPVATVLNIGTEDGLEWNEVEIQVIDPKAVFEVENGLLKALSVGILVDYDGIDFLEDGGWIINDYILAEISLVDHPANYDAKLYLSLGLTVDVIREKGFEACKQVGLLEESMKVKGRNKKEITPAAVAQAITEPEEVVANEQEESPDAAAEVVVEQAEEAETVADVEEPVAVEDVADVAEPDAEEATVEPEAEAAPDHIDLSVMVESVKTLQETVTNMQESFTKALELISKSLSAQPEAVVESEAALGVEEVPASEDVGEVGETSDLAKRVDALEELVRASVPARRTAAVGSDGLIPEELAPAAEEAGPERPKNLRDAVTKFVEGAK